MKIDQSAELTAFYKAYLAWVENGAPTDHAIFKRKYGLCSNFIDWADSETSIDELADQFEADGLNFLHPFNDSPEDYNRDTVSESHHLNEQRIAWVKSHV